MNPDEKKFEEWLEHAKIVDDKFDAEVGPITTTTKAMWGKITTGTISASSISAGSLGHAHITGVSSGPTIAEVQKEVDKLRKALDEAVKLVEEANKEIADIWGMVINPPVEKMEPMDDDDFFRQVENPE